MGSDETRKDLRAAVAARQELGPEYENEIIDSFLEKLDARVAERAPAGPPKPAPPAYELQREKDPGGLALAIVSVGAAIPITAIAANTEGLFAVVISWCGLVGINLARSVSRFAGHR